MRVLVTGGLGYIGSHVVAELIKQGHAVEIVDNLSNSSLSVLKALEQLTGAEIPFHELTLGRDRLQEHTNLWNFDAVMHFAGYKSVEESQRKPEAYYTNNVGTTMDLIS